MRHRLSIAAAAAVLILGAGAAFAANPQETIFAPLWVYPNQPQPRPVTIVNQTMPKTVVIREQPPLLTPADLRFSVEDENGVTVVRGPRAR